MREDSSMLNVNMDGRPWVMVPTRHPTLLVWTWREQAVESAVVEPHAMTLSTIGADGGPDARVLVLKDAEDGAWWFAGSIDSVKRRQISAHPSAPAYSWTPGPHL